MTEIECTVKPVCLIRPKTTLHARCLWTSRHPHHRAWCQRAGYGWTVARRCRESCRWRWWEARGPLSWGGGTALLGSGLTPTWVRVGVGRERSSEVTNEGKGPPGDGSRVPGRPLEVMTGVAPAGPTLRRCPKLLTRDRWTGPCRRARRGSAGKPGTGTDLVLEQLPAPLISPLNCAIPLGSGGPARRPSPLDPL